jgi:acetyl esterase/lipase
VSDIILEPAAQEFADATAKPPLLYELGVEGARKLLDDVQSGPVEKLDVDEKWITVPAQVGDVRVRIVRPVGSTGVLPVILYVHGGGWILGNAGTHDRLVRELAVGAEAAVVFVEYDRSPEAKYPVAIEQAYATAQWITTKGTQEGLDASRLVVAGDSVGGNMSAALTHMAKRRGDVTFLHQSLYYPVTDAAQDTESYRVFAHGPHLTAKAMEWFWDAYTTDPVERSQITASPLRATLEDLQGLPPAYVVVDENDVLRDEGEAYAKALEAAGVPVTLRRYDGPIHGFFRWLAKASVSRRAVDEVAAALREGLA